MLEKLLKKIDKYEIITFDIFDTLLFRNVYHPTDIFKIMQEKLKDKYNIENFYDIRTCSEAKARIGKKNNECTFDEIYEEIGKHLNSNETEYAKKLEIELEEDFLCVNPFMKKVYDYCKSNNKEIYFISDMYLPANVISKILFKNGYKNEKTYISCEYRENKAGGGSLFKLVQNENNLDKNKWLHIGDNIVSDYRVPIEIGISAYRYKNVREYYTKYIPNTIEESIITAIQNNNVYNGLEIEYWDKFGILNVSPLYFSFTLWLYELTKDKDNLFFLARDGYIIEKIYKLFPKTKLFTNYIYCSRKSLQTPSLYDCSDDYLTYILTLKNDLVSEKVTLANMFKSAQLDYKKKKYLPIIKWFGFDSFDVVINNDNYEAAKKLIASQIDDIKKNIKTQRDLAIKYLNQEGMKKYKKINVVDVGWSGSIQYAIKKLLKKDVTGYYFGTIVSNKENIYSTMFGYYFDLDNKWIDREEIMQNVMMYELLFSAPHGPTIKYKKGNTIEPVLGEDDNSAIIEQFHKSALDIIKEYLKYYDYFKVIDKYFATFRIRNFIKDKKYEDVKAFHELSSDLILNSNKKYPFVQEFTKKYINNHFGEFMKKKNDSLWKGSFIITDGTEQDYKIVCDKIKKDSNNKVKNLRRRFIPYSIRKKLKKIIKK